MTVRLMAPFTMSCNTCGEFICESEVLCKGIELTERADKGKKFNAKKETAKGEEYYGIKIFRFYIVRSLLVFLPSSLTILSSEMHSLLCRNHVQDGPEKRRLHLRTRRETKFRADDGGSLLRS